MCACTVFKSKRIKIERCAMPFNICWQCMRAYTKCIRSVCILNKQYAKFRWSVDKKRLHICATVFFLFISIWNEIKRKLRSFDHGATYLVTKQNRCMPPPPPPCVCVCICCVMWFICNCFVSSVIEQMSASLMLRCCRRHWWCTVFACVRFRHLLSQRENKQTTTTMRKTKKKQIKKQQQNQTAKQSSRTHCHHISSHFCLCARPGTSISFNFDLRTKREFRIIAAPANVVAVAAAPQD